MSRSRRLLVIAGLLAAVMVVADVLLLSAARSHDQEAAARRSALRAARTLVPVLLSYDYRSLDHDLTRSRATTTGSFRRDYDKLIGDVVRPSAASRQVRTSAVVSGAGVVAAGSARATVLVFLTQTSTSSLRRTPAVTGSRVRVSLAKRDGRWLIAGLDPV